MPHLARRPQRPAVVAVCPDAASAAKAAIDRLRQTDAQPLHPASEGSISIRFDEEMNVIHLDAEVRDVKRGGASTREATPHGGKEPCAAQRRKTRHGSHRDVNRVSVLVDG